VAPANNTPSWLPNTTWTPKRCMNDDADPIPSSFPDFYPGVAEPCSKVALDDADQLRGRLPGTICVREETVLLDSWGLGTRQELRRIDIEFRSTSNLAQIWRTSEYGRFHAALFPGKVTTLELEASSTLGDWTR